MLIGSYFADKILLITPLLKWYINHGLEVTKIYEVVQYLPVKCFKNFGLQVSEAQRSGDSNPNKAELAQTFKLWGNSSYEKTICNKEKHRNIRYCNSEAVSELINDLLFHKLNAISENLYEIEHFKKKIVLDLPIQIGFFVYGYAKLRMLEFYYNFLNFYINRQDFECYEMDTDSLYYALSSFNLENVIKPEKRRNFMKIITNDCLPKHVRLTRRSLFQKKAKVCRLIHIRAVLSTKILTSGVQDYLNWNGKELDSLDFVAKLILALGSKTSRCQRG